MTLLNFVGEIDKKTNFYFCMLHLSEPELEMFDVYQVRFLGLSLFPM